MLPIVDPTEEVPIQFDFTDILAAYTGAAISAQRLAIELKSGIDATPASRLVGLPAVAGLVVTQYFKADPSQVDQAKYRVSCNIDVAGYNYKPTIAVEVIVGERTDA